MDHENYPPLPTAGTTPRSAGFTFSPPTQPVRRFADLFGNATNVHAQAQPVQHSAAPTITPANDVFNTAANFGVNVDPGRDKVLMVVNKVQKSPTLLQPVAQFFLGGCTGTRPAALHGLTEEQLERVRL